MKTPPRGGKKVRRWVVGSGYPVEVFNEVGDVGIGIHDGRMKETRWKTYDINVPDEATSKKCRLILEECE